MGNNCAYCRTYFEAKRSHKKYCSDNCKQMAYFARNGFTLSGTNASALTIKNEVINQEKVQEHPIAIEPLNVKEENSVIVKYDLPTEPENVKYNSEKESVKYDKHTETVKYEEERMESDFTEVKNTRQKIYCSPVAFDNILSSEAKTPFNYCTPCESSFIHRVAENAVIPTQETETEPSLIENHETHQPINNGESLPNTQENETQSKKEEQKKNATEILQEPNLEKKAYQWVNSKFIRQIEFFTTSNDHKDMLKKPLRYWSYEQTKQVTWVNIRLRCLIESLIRLSNYSGIDKHTLSCVANAFSRLCSGFAYNLQVTTLIRN